MDIGQTATNPETGEKIVFTEQGWQPYTNSATNPDTGERVFDFGQGWQPLGQQFAMPQEAQPVQAEEQSMFGGVLDEFTKGLTFGLGPFLTAGEAAVLGRRPGDGLFDVGNYGDTTFRQRFDEALAAEQGQNKQFIEEHPAVAVGAQVAGGLTTTVLVPGANLTRFAGPTATGKAIAAGAEGAAIGAGFAAGEGRDVAEGAGWGLVAGGGGSLLLSGLGRVSGGMSQYVKESRLLAQSPTLQQLRSKTTRLYQRAEKSGVVFPKDKVVSFIDDLDDELRKAGMRPGLTDKSASAMRYIKQDASRDLSFQEVDEMRRLAGIAARSLDNPDDARLGMKMVEAIDDFVNSQSGDLGAIGRQARTLWSRVRRDEMVAEAIEKAGNNASGIEQGLRVEFRKILNNPKKLRGFSKAEQAYMQKIVKGTSTQNTLRNVAKLGFQPNQPVGHVLSGAAGTGGGLALGGPVGGLAVQGAASGSRLAADALQRRNAQVLGAMVRSGATPAQMRSVSQALERIGNNERAFQAYIRTLEIGSAAEPRAQKMLPAPVQ